MSNSCNPMDYSILDSFVPRISQVIILEWVAISFSRRSSWPRDQIRVSCISGEFFTNWATRGAPNLVECICLGLFQVLYSVLLIYLYLSILSPILCYLDYCSYFSWLICVYILSLFFTTKKGRMPRELRTCTDRTYLCKLDWHLWSMEREQRTL